jgi:hypothetical protein
MNAKNAASAFGTIKAMSKHSQFARQAAATLLKLARTVSDPQMAATFVDLAADLKERIGEHQPPLEVDAIVKDDPAQE